MFANHYRSTVDYIKCIRANPLSEIGYATMAISAVLTFQDYDNLFYNTAFACAGILSFVLAKGVTRETYKAYSDTKKHINKRRKKQKRKEMGKKFLNQWTQEYCDRKGVELAVREAGLEDLLNI